MPAKPGTFGPGVLGEEQFKRELIMTKKGASIFGPGILGYDPNTVEYDDAGNPIIPSEPLATKEPEPSPAPKPAADFVFPDVSLPDLRDALAGNPYLLDAAIEREFQREPEARRGALRVFLEYERDKPDPRQEVVQRLEEALNNGGNSIPDS